MNEYDNDDHAYRFGGVDSPLRDGRGYDDEPEKKRGGGFFRALWRVFSVMFIAGFVVAIAGLVYAFIYVKGLEPELPDYTKLENYQPKVTTRIHAGDGTLVAEFARERRLFVPAESIPDTVKQAFISAEDKTFYEHDGIYWLGIPRAALNNIENIRNGAPLEGASTITQQVAKNFLLTSDQKIERKVKEAIIARRMEKVFSKEEILELYLNEIYLGNRSYGVAAAALNYFGKPLSEIEPHEAAYLATLAKAPANYHPVYNESRAIARRDWILGQMFENGYLTAEELAFYRDMPLGAQLAPPLGARSAAFEYFAEEVRRDVAERYGTDALYDGGLSVRTTIDPELQLKAEKAFREGLAEYDMRHGWRGPLTTISLPEDLDAKTTVEREGDEEVPLWALSLREAKKRLVAERKSAEDLAPWKIAVVLSTTDAVAEIGFRDGSVGSITLPNLSWARQFISINELGPEVESVTQVLTPGDVILVEPVEGDNSYALRQIPAANGGMLAMDPHTGRIKAMVGGFSFGLSEFNRSTQAWRQPGSTFKPFIYAAALDNGYTPSSIVLDAPFVAPGLDGTWYKPGNYVADRFYGDSTLRLGIEKSRNTMTARLAQDLGIGTIIEYAERMGVSDRLPRNLSISLGAGETTLMRLTAAYAQFVNGGKKIEPTIIDRVQDRHGDTIFASDDRPCFGCNVDVWENQEEPPIVDDREQVIDPRTAFQMVSIMEGVIERGTGTKIREMFLDEPLPPLAGKTGTTNDYRDAWFVGFSPDLAVGVFVGFDMPQSLGNGEGGGNVAAPIFGKFMKDALVPEEVVPFRAPSGIRLVRVNARTGKPANANEPNVILEAFKAEDDIYGRSRRFTGDGNINAPTGDEDIDGDLGVIY
ncbi:penicillin-binding protein 1A [Parvularcula lutaonensis]|uniref:Penicillin-binding protein 1A n=1 Tax=Parvularcula lutaonensis TaxID=491923 RepID=A0ABV7MBL4_9PROT|nr:penicillin-binding protein 1A [Parvularcula lutaonensis]GGY40751.1 penicillin-binding protein 1A [Parvularcula lutaonensis]